ncbi:MULTISPECIES: C40 family peptidase [Rhizobium]|uniref:C40 family peptidase n=1 Tax=Rhizobium TaxID=379 RepID=UPI0007EB3702|nr:MULTISPECIES: NlpC/P60 family protein [Rhizobium]ANK89768.1 NLPC/P60 domain-containing protein [Rhizobium sp. N6212]ANK95795.1 NLPC/P60 domain-containing protein [Rhizobium sp. N621]ANL01823.1 NLPC/P60 domain-containing protein [Rhizobium esperanzae]ANL07951.1 NLPC/P60 domain-containing protein [Rhizobium sp. N1341]ANL19997.1 NLPC/P60 domain-containing protein [Rhizobium sp. N113]
MTMLDRRLHAYRPDLAEAGLEGKVEASRFVEGAAARVALPVAALRPEPDLARGIDTELLLGEDVSVFDRADGWCWVKAVSDGYVGYLKAEALSQIGPAPTHIVTVQRTFLYPEPELRKPHRAILSMGSRVHVAGEAEVRGNHYVVLTDGTAIFARHVQPIGALEGADYVGIAARFLETPYLWGGRSGLGIDCSGLVQLAMLMTGRQAPRDADMQAAGLGEPIDRSEIRRGDLVFWKGHVAIFEDPQTILHANGHSMTVARENFEAAVERIGSLYQRPTGYRRPFS